MSARVMSRFLTLGLAGSLLAHGAAYAALADAPKVAPVRPLPSSVEFEVAAAKPAPPAPVTPVRPEPQQPTPVPRPLAPAPPAPAAPPTPAAPVDLGGLTLTNDSGDASWSSPSGDGSTSRAPLGPIGKTSAPAPTTPALPRAPAAPAPTTPALVASQDLSDRPRPPALDAALRHHYPPEARMRAISGTASLRVRIDADGRVRSAALLNETFAGFGDACRR